LVETAKYYRFGSTLLFYIICISLLSYFNPPGWVHVNLIGGPNEPEKVIQIARSELEEFPSILEALHLADTSLGYPIEQVKCTPNEGRKIVSHFGHEHFSSDSSYRLHLEIDGQLYSVSIIFIHKPPPMA
jgi:hypothetical protein